MESVTGAPAAAGEARAAPATTAERRTARLPHPMLVGLCHALNAGASAYAWFARRMPLPLAAYMREVFGTLDPRHPLVAEMEQTSHGSSFSSLKREPSRVSAPSQSETISSGRIVMGAGLALSMRIPLDPRLPRGAACCLALLVLTAVAASADAAGQGWPGLHVPSLSRAATPDRRTRICRPFASVCWR